MINPASHIAGMSPYALAQLDGAAGAHFVSLSQNESLRPPSPRVGEAVARAMTDAQHYPDPDWCALRSALAELHDIPETGILCGNGSMELIASLAQAYADPQNAVLAPVHAYPFFRTAAQLVRARFVTAVEVDCRVSVDALLDAVRADTRIVFIANPGNPTGTRLPRSELVHLRDSLRADILLVIDEAYGEFADHLKEPLFGLVQRGDTVVLRSLSKAYGLVGMRVGWGLFPLDVAQEVRKVMNPNNISIAGQAAAGAVLADQEYMRETCAITARLRDDFIDRLRTAGFDIPDSFTNFSLIRLGHAEQAQSAYDALREASIFLRPQAGAGLANCLRVTVGASEDLERASGLLERWAMEYEA